MATKESSIHYDVKNFNVLFDKVYNELPLKKKKQYKTVLSEIVSTGILNVSMLLEMALANSGNFNHTSVNYMDFSDKSDAKLISSRWHGGKNKRGEHKNHGYNVSHANKNITNCHNYILIPRSAFEHLKSDLNISINKHSGMLVGRYAQYEVSTFDELCN